MLQIKSTRVNEVIFELVNYINELEKRLAKLEKPAPQKKKSPESSEG